MKQNTCPTLVLIVSTSMLLVSGCQSNPPETKTPQPSPLAQTQPPRNDTEAVQRLATQIQVAQSAADEATALEQLHKVQVERNLTYTVKAVRLDTNMTVPSASTQRYPVRVDVSVFKGQAKLYSFSFLPHDNHNLTYLGQ